MMDHDDDAMAVRADGSGDGCNTTNTWGGGKNRNTTLERSRRYKENDADIVVPRAKHEDVATLADWVQTMRKRYRANKEGEQDVIDEGTDLFT